MIDFEIPERIRTELQMAKMVAEQVMRDKSRYYDEHEHERPIEYINIMWPVLPVYAATLAQRNVRLLRDPV